MRTLTKEVEVLEANEIEINFVNEEQEISPGKRKEIDLHWAGIKECFNGKLIHVNGIEKKDNKILMSTCIGCYKDFVGTERPGTIEGINTARDCCIPLSIGAITITKDNKIVVAKRQGTYLNNNRWSFPAEGYMVPNETLRGNIGLEMKEELLVESCDFFEILGIVFETRTRNPYISVVWKTNLASWQIESRFMRTEREEFKRIAFIENERSAFLDFCRSYELTLHNLGKSILYSSYMGW